jgi:hypothetical protein
MELLTVVRDDTGRFLSAMLQSVQAKGCQCRRIRMSKDPEHAALLAQAIVTVLRTTKVAGCQIGVVVKRHGRLPLKHPLRATGESEGRRSGPPRL